MILKIISLTFKCDQGWSNSKTCNDDVNECLDSNICLNNGTCVNEPGSYKCQCSNGYVGSRCENKIDYCSFDPCHHANTVKCLNNYTLNNFVCVCKTGNSKIIEAFKYKEIFTCFQISSKSLNQFLIMA